MHDTNLPEQVERLKFQVAALEQLLEVHEQTVLDHSDRIEHALQDLQRTTAELRFLNDAVEQSTQPFRAADLQGRIVRFNRAFERLSGYSADELRTMTYMQLTPARWHEIDRQQFAQVLATGKAVRYEKEYLRKDGTVVPVELVGDLYRNAAGEPEYLVVFLTDITERKRAEEELRWARDTLEDIVRERTAALVQANRALLAENTERQRAEEALGQALQGLRQHSRQMRGLAQAALAMNSERALAVVLQVVTDQARAIIGVHQAVTSLTVDQNWAQAVTNLSFSDRYAAYRTYDAKPDGSGIYALVCETNRPLRLTQAELEAHPRWRGFGQEAGRHPPMVGWLAAPLVDAEGKNLGLIQLSDKVEGEFTAEDEAILVQLAQMASVTLEIRQAHDALEARVQERTAALTQANEALQLEIADRVRAQEALARQAQALARSNSELEQFAYVASHDLQEPLRMVASYTQLLADRYRGQLDDKANRWIAYAVEGVTRMRTLIDDLLAYSRAGRPGQVFTPTDCAAVLAKALTYLQKAIEESGAVVTHDPLPSVHSAGPHLLHLFQNLLSNALKFRGPEPPRIHVAAQDKGTEWVFSVRDNGLGIDPEHFERIFVIFQRLHSRQEYPGTGIGLAICKKIVEQHGGRIWVESQPGHGTTFYFTLPKQGGSPE
jgi:PAS domain S-box-containing protein